MPPACGRGTPAAGSPSPRRRCHNLSAQIWPKDDEYLHLYKDDRTSYEYVMYHAKMQHITCGDSYPSSPSPAERSFRSASFITGRSLNPPTPTQDFVSFVVPANTHNPSCKKSSREGGRTRAGAGAGGGGPAGGRVGGQRVPQRRKRRAAHAVHHLSKRKPNHI